MDGMIIFLIIVALIALLAGAVKLVHNKVKTGSFLSSGGSSRRTHIQ